MEEASKEYEKFTAVRVPKQTVYSHLKYELESPCYSYSKLRELRTKFEDLIKGSQHHADFQSKLQNLQEVTESVMTQVFNQKKSKLQKQREDNHKAARLLTDDEDDQLVELCRILAASGHGFDRGKVLEYMNAIAPPPDGQKSHSVSALNRFLKRRSDNIGKKNVWN